MSETQTALVEGILEMVIANYSLFLTSVIVYLLASGEDGTGDVIYWVWMMAGQWTALGPMHPSKHSGE